MNKKTNKVGTTKSNSVPIRVSIHQQNNLVITATTLKLLSQNKTSKVIAQIRKTTKRNINKLLKKYIKKGYILDNRELTEKGRELIKKAVPFSSMVSNSVPTPTIRLHDLQFNLEILRKPKKWDKHRTTITKLRKYNPTNWKLKSGTLLQEFVINDLTIRVTNKSVLVKPRDIYSETPEEALNKATELLENAIPQIEHLFSIKLSKERKLNIKVTRQHLAFIHNNLAQYCLNNNIYLKVRDENGELRAVTDNSKGLAELEFIHPQHSEDDARIILEKDIEDKLTNKFYPASQLSKMMDSEIQSNKEFKILIGEMGKQLYNSIKLQENNSRQLQTLLTLLGGSIEKNNEPKLKESTTRQRYVG